MNNELTYQFSFLRYVHDLAHAEFVNVGIAMFIPSNGQLIFRVNENYGRLSEFYRDFDGNVYRQLVRHVEGLLSKCSQSLQQEQIFEQNAIDMKEILDSAMSPDSTVFHWSKILGGISENPTQRFDHLYANYIIYNQRKEDDVKHDEVFIDHEIKQSLRRLQLDQHVRKDVTIRSDHFAYNFRYGWKNGQDQVLEPVSFDLQRHGQIRDKANTWVGRLINLSQTVSFMCTVVIAKPSDPNNIKAFNDAYAILKQSKNIREIVSENEAEDFLNSVRGEIEAG